MRNWKLTPNLITAISLAIFLLLSLVGFAISNLFDAQRRSERQFNLRQVASNQAHTIQRQLDQSLSSTYALAAIIKQNNGVINDFDLLAAEMLEIYSGISSLQLAPGGVVAQIYPLKGNEAALGFNAFEVPDRREEAISAVSNRKLTLAGPYEIVQGGTAMIGRYPVFVTVKNGDEEFWGFTQALIFLPEFIEAANLNRLESNGFSYVLQKIDSATNVSMEIASSDQLPAPNGVLIDFEVPNATWRLILNYQQAPGAISILGVGILLTISLALLVSILTNKFLHQNLALQTSNLTLEREILTREQAQRETYLAYEKVEAANTQLEQQIDQLAASREALRQSETRYKTLLQAVPDLIIRIDDAGVLTDLKPDQSRLSDQLSERIGQAGEKTLPVSMVQPFFQAVSNARKYAKIQTFEFNYDSETGEVETYEARIGVQDNQQIMCVIRNVTNQKRMVTELITSQKLASLGSLAAGVAHEMNSPLQVIIGLSSSLEERIMSEEFDSALFLQNLQTISRNGWRAAEIVRSLLQYARPAVDEMQPIDLNEAVHETLMLIENQLKTWDHIHLDVNLEQALPRVMGKQSQVSQALINLLSNARDAMPQGGALTIRTVYDAQANQVLLQVADTGEGIPADKTHLIFDPFYTTKEVGQGTGLGLSIVLGIVNSHHADIRVDTEPGSGAIFTIAFPALNE